MGFPWNAEAAEFVPMSNLTEGRPLHRRMLLAAGIAFAGTRLTRRLARAVTRAAIRW